MGKPSNWNSSKYNQESEIIMSYHVLIIYDKIKFEL